MLLPLEDLFTDIIAKAQRGLGFDDAALAQKAGVSEDALRAVKSGTVDEETITHLAAALDLHAHSLLTIARDSWRPHPREVLGLHQFTTPFKDMTVNAYLVWDTTTKVGAAFDTGADASELVDMARAFGVRIEHIFLTHTHPDHVADIATLRKPNTTLHSCSKEPWEDSVQFDCGQEFTLSSLRIETKQTWGHSRGGVSYVVHGLSKPLIIVGDALFAGSMGGGMVSYADALATNREHIFSLHDDTIICPGHGPMTTVGEEKEHNPFFPEIKKAPHPAPSSQTQPLTT